MSRIVLTTIGSFGDLHPKIAIALELQKRGHDIVFATHQQYQSQIEALGFEFYRMRPDVVALDNTHQMAGIMDLKTGLRETYIDLMNAAKDADFILAGELVVCAARLVTEKLGIRWAMCALQPAALKNFTPSPSLLAGVGSNSYTSNALYQLQDKVGLSALRENPVFDDNSSPYLNLALLSSVLAKSQPGWPENTLMTGFTFYDEKQEIKPTSELAKFLEGEPPIVFTLDLAAEIIPGNFYQESIKAAQKLNRPVVLLVGKNPPPDNLPQNVLAIKNIPYSYIFRYACAIVHQGGISSTSQAFRSACPSLIVPYRDDQFDNAARVEKLGASRTIPDKEYSASRVEQELHELLDNDTYAIRAADIGHIIQSENGLSVACDAIEKQLKEAIII